MQPPSNDPTFHLAAAPVGATVPPPSREANLARAEQRGRQVLLYAPDGPMGGSFACTRCIATALQPDLLVHREGCPYRGTSGGWRR
jgi:hypothetical protein